MKLKTAIFATLAGSAAIAAPAFAHDGNIGGWGHGRFERHHDRFERLHARPVVVVPPRVVYAPAPFYYTPAPVYYRPAPVYYSPAPAYPAASGVSISFRLPL